MTLLNYTDPVPIPAPLAAGAAIQSYTDPTGDVWVAKGGVNNGNWFRARDVVHARWYKNAAQNTANGVVTVAMDTANRDPYGLWNTGSNAFYAPVPGIYQGFSHLTVTPSAAGQVFSNRIYSQGIYQNVTQFVSQGATALTVLGVLQWYLNSGDYMQPALVAPAVLAITTGTFWTWMSFDYLGTG